MSGELELSEHARAHRSMWNEDASNWVERGRANWAADEPHWGAWHVPEAEVGILPDVSGLDVVDLGCGTGYWCAWLARRGARPVGIDVSEASSTPPALCSASTGSSSP